MQLEQQTAGNAGSAGLSSLPCFQLLDSNTWVGLKSVAVRASFHRRILIIYTGMDCKLANAIITEIEVRYPTNQELMQILNAVGKLEEIVKIY